MVPLFLTFHFQNLNETSCRKTDFLLEHLVVYACIQ